MEFNKCSRCGSFYLSNGNVCPKCSSKDKLEFSAFKNYVEENGLTENLDIIQKETGISIKNINRFLTYENYNNSNTEININKTENLANNNIDLR